MIQAAGPARANVTFIFPSRTEVDHEHRRGFFGQSPPREHDACSASLPREDDRAAPAAARPERAGANSGLLLVYVASLISGLLISVAWFVTETIASAVLGWASAVLLIYSVRTRKAYLPAYCCGLVVHAVGFYWIYGTLGAFGGFGPIVSAAIFSLYVATGALIFLVFAAIHHNLGPAFDAFALRCPVAIVVAELVTIRVFHWHFGHTQVAFTPFVQIAGLGGAMFVSFVMFWLAEAGVRLVLFRERRRAFVIPVVVFLFALGYGALQMATFGTPGQKTQEVLLVQGDPSLAGKRDAESAWQYVARIHDLSRRSARKATLVVWPEGVDPAYIPADLGSVETSRRSVAGERLGIPGRGLFLSQRTRNGTTPPSPSIPTARSLRLTSSRS